MFNLTGFTFGPGLDADTIYALAELYSGGRVLFNARRDRQPLN